MLRISKARLTKNKKANSKRQGLLPCPGARERDGREGRMCGLGRGHGWHFIPWPEQCLCLYAWEHDTSWTQRQGPRAWACGLVRHWCIQQRNERKGWTRWEIAWLLEPLILCWAHIAEPWETSPEETQRWWRAVSDPSCLHRSNGCQRARIFAGFFHICHSTMNSNLALLNAEAQQVPPIAHLHSTDSFGFHDLLFKAPIVP